MMNRYYGKYLATTAVYTKSHALLSDSSSLIFMEERKNSEMNRYQTKRFFLQPSSKIAQSEFDITKRGCLNDENDYEHVLFATYPRNGCFMTRIYLEHVQGIYTGETYKLTSSLPMVTRHKQILKGPTRHYPEALKKAWIIHTHMPFSGEDAMVNASKVSGER